MMNVRKEILIQRSMYLQELSPALRKKVEE
jgi:hypothetical protein